jgi:hypothetical protein
MKKPRRDALEIVTAVMLGLVSVAAALGAYQATAWTNESIIFQRTSDELRDRNLNLALTSQLTFADDAATLFSIVALESEASLYPDRAARLATDKKILLASASPEVAVGWDAWDAAGRPQKLFPLTTPAYESALKVPALSMNYVSLVAFESAQRLQDRADRMTVAAIAFAVALLFLGTAGIYATPRVTILLIGFGGLAFLIGLLTVGLAAT